MALRAVLLLRLARDAPLAGELAIDTRRCAGAEAEAGAESEAEGEVSLLGSLELIAAEARLLAHSQRCVLSEIL